MNRFLKKIPLAALCAAMAAACAGGATDATITVDASKVEGSVTPLSLIHISEPTRH